jgi:chromosomal replication initiation ATPase DnaA
MRGKSAIQARLTLSQGEERHQMMNQKLHIAHLMIEDLACRRAGVSLEALYGKARGRARVVFARHLYLYLLHGHLAGSISATAIAAGRDRRMVAYALGRVEQRRDSDPAFDRMIDLFQDEARRLIANAQARSSLCLQSPATIDLVPQCPTYNTPPTYKPCWHA